MSAKGHAFIDRALYLSKAWTSNPARLAAAHVPQDTAFATKPRLAVDMVVRAVAASVPFAWVAGDSVYGVGELEMALQRADRGYVLGVKGNHWFGSWHPDRQVVGEAQDIARAFPAEAWQRLSAGHGTKGERLYDWVYCPLADLDAAEYDAPTPGIWTRGLPIRRSLADGEHAYFTTWSPTAPPSRFWCAWKARWASGGRLRDHQNRTGPRPQRKPLMALLASACLAGL